MRGGIPGDLVQDLRYAARWLVKRPGFSLAVVTTLALAIGANGAIFTVVEAVLLRSLPYGDPDALVAIWSRQPMRDKAPFNIPDFIDLRERNDVLDDIAAFAAWNATLAGDGVPVRLQGVRATGNLFALLRAGAAAGRPLLATDDRPGAPPVVVLTDAFWRRRFGADPSVMGLRLALDGVGYTVVGVLRPEFVLPFRDVEIVAPLGADSDPLRGVRGSISFLRVIGRLGPGVTRGRAEEGLTAIAGRLRREHPDANERKIGTMVTPLAGEIAGGFGSSLVALLAAVGAVLLIACANLASLFLARGASRRTEMAARLALGATPARLARQVLTEVALFAALGGACGVAVAAPGVRLLATFAPADLPRRGEIHVDGVVLLFTLGVSLVAGLIVGAAPALLAARADVADGLKARGRGSSAGRGERGMLRWLVAAETAAALVLLVAVGLLARTFANLQAVDPGFAPGGAVAARVSLAGGGYADREALLAYQRRVQERLAGQPVVASAGAVSILPLSGQQVRIDFTVEGRPFARQEVPSAQYRMVTPECLAAMGVPLRRGRMLAGSDAAAAAPVVLVNETLARRFFPEADPIGAHLLIDDNNTGARPVEIVGVVGDVKHLGLDGDPTNDLYLPYAQLHPDNLGLAASNMTWIVRTRTDPAAAAKSVRDALQSAGTGVPIASVVPFADSLSAVMAPRRFNLFVIALFAAAAVLLAAIGTYGVLSYSVGERADEMAIRRALGARPRHILWLVLAQGMRPILAGMVLGVAAAVALTRLLTSLLFGVSASDPATFAGVALVLLVVGVAACLVPAARAALTDDAVRA